ncbi:hypothetical protein [Bacillus thuringiensis]|nr:hypothetical protein [Bacillus thuringiensis]MEC3147948.1 hypothetical protein [Bacillus thuringiensis]MED2596025.1 hypothetical protein [Bacillus thuringiensis]
MKQMSKEGWGALFGLILVVTGIYVVNLTIGSLNEMNDEYLKSKNNAIVALVSSELDVPKKEIVLKKENNENEEIKSIEWYTATTSKGVYQLKVKETIDFDKQMSTESKPVIENMAQVKIGSTDN